MESRHEDDGEGKHTDTELSEMLALAVKNAAKGYLKTVAPLDAAGAIIEYLDDKKINKYLQKAAKITIPLADGLEKFLVGYPTVENALHHGETIPSALIKGAAIVIAVEQGMHSIDSHKQTSLMLNLISNVFKDKSLRKAIIKDTAKGILKINMLAPLAHVFIVEQDLRAKGHDPITSAIATTIGVSAGLGANLLGAIAIASGAVEAIPAPPVGIASILVGASLIATSSHLAQTVAENTAVAISKVASTFPDVKRWLTLKTHELIDKLKNIEILSEAHCTTEIVQFTKQTLNEAQVQGLSDDHLILFGYLLQQSIVNGINQFNEQPSQANEINHFDFVNIIKDVETMQRQLNESPIYEEAKRKIQQQVNADQILMDMITDIDISGYEDNAEIKAHYEKLQALKNSHAPSDAIYECARGLTSSITAESHKRKTFDTHIDNVAASLSMTASVASLFGKDKLSQQINGIVNAGYQITKAIASQLGYGLLAGCMTPIGAGAAILGGCAQLAGLFKKQKDPNQAMFHLLQTIQDTLNEFRIHNDKRFDEVMDAIGMMNAQMVNAFMQSDWKSNVLIDQLFKLTQKMDVHFNEQRESSATINDHLQDITEQLARDSKNQVISAIISETGTMINDHDPFDKYPQYIAAIETKTLTPLTGAMSPSMIGETASVADYKATKEGFVKLMKPFNQEHSYFFINTLLTYFNSHHFGNDFYYSKEEMEILIKAILNNHPGLHFLATIELGDLLLGDNKRPEDYSGEVVTSLAEWIRSDIAKDRYLLTLLTNNGWRLLFIDENKSEVHFYGMIDFISDRVADIIASHDKLANFQFCFHPTIIPNDLNPFATSLLVLEQVRVIKEGGDIKPLSTALTNDELKQMHLTNLETLKGNHVLQATPANPLLWQYLSWALLNMTDRIYPDTELAHLCYSEVARFQRFMNHGVYLANILHRLRNPAMFELILDQYVKATATLFEALKKEQQAFEQKQLDNHHQLLIRLANAMMDTLQLSSQTVEVRTDYDTSWFATFLIQFHKKKGHENNIRFIRDNPAQVTSSKQNYLSTQTSAIKNSASAHAARIINKRSNIAMIGQIQLGQPHPILIRLMPALLLPTNPAHPVLPMRDDIIHYIDDRYFKAQQANFGQIKCFYSIQNNQFSIELRFVPNNGIKLEKEKFCDVKMHYNSLFYTGNEAVWWYWCGGNYVTSKTYVTETKVGSEQGQGGAHNVSYDYYIKIPTPSPVQGMYQTFSPGNVHVVTQCALPADQIIIDQAISDHQSNVIFEWHNELFNKIAANEHSSLGKALAEWDACYALLHAYSQLVLNVMDKPLDILSEYIQASKDYIWNRGDLLSRIDLHECVNPASLIISEEQIEKLHHYLSEVFNTKIHPCGYTPKFNLNLLLEAFWDRLDIFAPKMKPGKTISIRAKESRQHLDIALRAIDTGAQLLDDFDNLNPEEMKKRAKQMAEMMRQFVDLSRNQLALQNPDLNQLGGMIAYLPTTVIPDTEQQEKPSNFIRNSVFNKTDDLAVSQAPTWVPKSKK